MIVDRNNRIVDTGYNGPPRGYFTNDAPCSEWCKRYEVGRRLPMSLEHGMDPDYHDCYSLHAEQNALMFSDRRNREGGAIYVSSGVCGTCAKLIANSGLKNVVYARPAPHRDSDCWVNFMENCGLTVVEYVEPE